MFRKETGATAVTCLLRPEGEGFKLAVANVGDCRAVLCRNGLAKRLTRDHLPSDEDEKKRIEDAGAFVTHGRLLTHLSVSRTIGTHVFKRWTPPLPHVWEGPVGPRDTFLVLATRGLWDVLSDQQVIEVAQGVKGAKAMCTALVKEALDRDSQNNITVMVVRFLWSPTLHVSSHSESGATV
mmetsp:Transcript_66351/g.177651  ORF Transcript_66351/g.177651 Transcript_66351/m.177651 type:complete len:181 (-) Transcript_66351:221-763(-)